jgi:hypothetical protein
MSMANKWFKGYLFIYYLPTTSFNILPLMALYYQHWCIIRIVPKLVQQIGYTLKSISSEISVQLHRISWEKVSQNLS